MYTYPPPPNLPYHRCVLSDEGALLEAILKWGRARAGLTGATGNGRCGARGHASQAWTRGALGNRPCPMMGRCLQWLDGSGRRAGKPAWISELVSHLLPEVRSQGRRSRRGGAPGGVAVCCCLPAIREISRGLLTMRLSALRLPSSSRGDLGKPRPRKRRENAEAWLFEIADRICPEFGSRPCARYRGCSPQTVSCPRYDSVS